MIHGYMDTSIITVDKASLLKDTLARWVKYKKEIAWKFLNPEREQEIRIAFLAGIEQGLKLSKDMTQKNKQN